MILISHRGNINGSIKSLENNPIYLNSAIKMGYDIELDVWYINNELWTGHDYPQYHIDLDWLESRIKNIWIHCKNIDILLFLKLQKKSFNFFWHENDTISLTSKGYIWAYPGKQPISNSIAVLPELYNDKIKECIGICSDKIGEYRDQHYDKNNYL
jgi:hypothetical protein